MWFGACFVCIAFVYFFIYETKGLTLEEVDDLYHEVSSARKSTNWKPSTTFQQRGSVAAEGTAEPSDTEKTAVGRDEGRTEENVTANGHSAPEETV